MPPVFILNFLKDLDDSMEPWMHSWQETVQVECMAGKEYLTVNITFMPPFITYPFQYCGVSDKRQIVFWLTAFGKQQLNNRIIGNMLFNKIKVSGFLLFTCVIHSPFCFR